MTGTAGMEGTADITAIASMSGATTMTGDNDWRGYSRCWGDADEQCHSARPYAFVLHGLWPQYERRGWPENV